MTDKRFYFLGGVLLVVVLTQSGCALLQIPATVIEGTFSLVGKLIGLANRLPKPPPGVFF